MSAHVLELAEIYASEHGRLKRIVKRLVGSKATAEDLVHQAFLKLIMQAEAGAPDNCPAYLTSAVRNLALNHLRDTMRKSEVALTESDFHAIVDTAPTPEANALYRSELRRVLHAVAALPARRREAFVLNRFEGLSYDEIAVRQGISRNTVISQIVSALAELNRSLEQE